MSQCFNCEQKYVKGVLDEGVEKHILPGKNEKVEKEHQPDVQLLAEPNARHRIIIKGNKFYKLCR